MPDAARGPLILGASGQVGFFLLHRLGADALACSRRIPVLADDAGARWQRLDLWTDTWQCPTSDLISAGPLDACVAWLQRSGPGRLRRIVALSSMSAVHKLESPSRDERAVAVRLREHEQQLCAFADQHGIRCTLVRPTLIWGAGLDRSLTPYAQRAGRRGWALIPSGARGLRQPVHADDLAALCVALLTRAATSAAQDIVEVGGAERLSLASMLGRVAQSQGARSIVLPLPRSSLRALGAFAARLGLERGATAFRATADQCVGSDASWSALGLAPRGFAPSASSWRAPESA